MKTEPVILTPAQLAFCQNTIESFNTNTWKITSAGYAGSDRKFFRIKAPDKKQSYILIAWNSSDHDWDRFLTLQKDLSSHLDFLPRIFAADPTHGLILEEDLGVTTLKKYCSKPSVSHLQFLDAYKKTLDALAKWQGIDRSISTVMTSRDMDKEMFLWESHYFATHCVSEFCGLEKLLGNEWEKERLEIALMAAGYERVCIHRDFQSENVLLCSGKVRFVDFQGARTGPAAYDVASLLYDPYMPQLTPALSKKLFTYYQSIAPVKVTEESFRICALQRIMQALGAYGNLSLHKGKEWYREYIPVALARLNTVLEMGDDYREIKRIVEECLGKVGK